MNWETKLKITGPSGSSLNFDGELTTSQKNIIVSVLHGIPDMAESKSYSKMLYAIADECRSGDATCPVRVSPEALDEAAERIDYQTVMIRGMEIQRDELLKVAQGILAEDMLQYLPAEYVANVRAVIASVKGGAA